MPRRSPRLHASTARRRRPTLTTTAFAGLGAALVAVGLAIVPVPTFTSVPDYRVDHEPLRFTAVSARSASVADDTTSTSTLPASAEAAPSPGTAASPGTAVSETAVSEIAEVDPFVTIGVSLPAMPSAPVSVRWRDADGWSEWHELEIEPDKGPDPATPEAAIAAAHRDGVVSEPLWVGTATAYQVSLPTTEVSSEASTTTTTTTTTTTEAAADAAPAVVVVRPDGAHLSVDSETAPAGAQSSVGQPAIHTRGEWGARAPSNSVGTASTLKLAVVHHSATGNDYSAAEVPGIIRSIQAYHMDGNGWSDIGYNFIVDKFGGMWEGRDGSLLRNSIGAHAEGFNTGSVGVMALGNFSTGAPTPVQVGNISDVIAWKFAIAGIDPSTRVDFTSGGSSTVPAGNVVNLPRVVGHRDVGSTDCPGSNLYAALSSLIRPALPALVAAKASPIGVIDIEAPGPRSVVLSGWALDPLETEPIEVHVYVDGVGRNLGPTPIDRPDLASAFPGKGTRHGFAATITDLAPGPHSVCVFGINRGPGSNTLLDCRVIVVQTGSPYGSIDQVQAGPDGTLAVAGWALDPDQVAGIEVHVYVDGVGRNLGPAVAQRDDISGAFPGYGGAHGFGWVTSGLGVGAHDVCIFGINTGAGTNSLLGCRTVVTPGGPPIGSVDAVVGGPDGVVSLIGWTVDPNTAASTDVHVYIDGTGTNIGRASQFRPDIAAAFPGYGAAHGFNWSTGGLSAGGHTACIFAIDTAGGTNSLLTCRAFVVPGGSPIGSIDAITGGGSRIGVIGWTIDPDTVAGIESHVYIDGVGYNTGVASQNRPDVAAAVPGYGPAHGISWLSPVLSPGTHGVCVFGINRGAGGNSLLVCRNVVV